jgi:exosome complex component RRP4
MGSLVPANGEKRMSNGQSGAEQRLVTPGEALGSSSGLRNGSGVVERDGEFFSTKFGYMKRVNSTISVVPTHSSYMPQSGDFIIGYIVEVRSNLWFLHINGPFQGLLPMSLAPWKVEFGESRKHLDIGDAVFARVQEVDESHNVVLTMKGVGLRKIAEGAVEAFPSHLIEIFLGKQNANLQKLRDHTNARIIATDNGQIWFDGDVQAMRKVRDLLMQFKSCSNESEVQSMIDDALH